MLGGDPAVSQSRQDPELALDTVAIFNANAVGIG